MEIQLDQADFTTVINSNSTVLLDFYADWCGPCQTLLPTVHKLADELKDEVTIKKVNVDKNRELASKFNIRSIPTLVFFKNGEPKDIHIGLITETGLRQKINQLK